MFVRRVHLALPCSHLLVCAMTMRPGVCSRRPPPPRNSSHEPPPHHLAFASGALAFAGDAVATAIASHPLVAWARAAIPVKALSPPSTPRHRGPARASAGGAPDDTYLPAARARVLSIRGDGRCLFRSIARSLALAAGRPLPEKLEVGDADALRALAWKEMCVVRKREFVDRMIVEGNMDAYCSALRRPSFYAGEAEMLALADVLRVPIAVYLREGGGGGGRYRKIAEYGAEWGKVAKGAAKTPVRVLYNGYNHYDALQKL